MTRREHRKDPHPPVMVLAGEAAREVGKHRVLRKPEVELASGYDLEITMSFAGQQRSIGGGMVQSRGLTALVGPDGEIER